MKWISNDIISVWWEKWENIIYKTLWTALKTEKLQIVKVFKFILGRSPGQAEKACPHPLFFQRRSLNTRQQCTVRESTLYLSVKESTLYLSVKESTLYLSVRESTLYLSVRESTLYLLVKESTNCLDDCHKSWFE